MRHWAAAVLTGASLWIGFPAGAEESSSALSSDEERWRALFRQGYEDIRGQRWEDARGRLAEAFAFRPSYDIALALAQAEYNLQRFRDAAEHLDYYLKHVPARERKLAIEDAKEIQKKCLREVARLRVSAGKEGAEVTLDGRVIGKAPLPGDQFVEPGIHRIEARLGALVARETVDAVAGKEHLIMLRLRANSPAAGTPGAGAPSLGASEGPLRSNARSPTTPPPESPGDSKKWPIVYVGAGVALAGLGVGAGLRWSADSDRDRAEQLKDKNGPAGCTTGAATAEDCRVARDAVEDFDRKRNLSTVAFVVSGVTAAAAVAYVFWPLADSAEKNAFRRIQLRGGLANGAAFLGLVGGF
jgi:hypothetical protein